MRTIRRRRLERKTDYKARFGLLKSQYPRLIARRTNRYVVVQIIETNKAQDKIVAGLTSKILLEKGWPKTSIGSLKNKTAAYLTGFLLGKMAQKKDIKEVVFDIGMHRNVHKSRLYAVLKGAIDSGLTIAHNPDVLPSEKDIESNDKYKPIMAKIIKE
ncbi:MAG: 50S ribosomal protein L18 [Nanoarchaeota archaeon]|nr:50S ribosomal protein L18 [Nanoarchaeota archaeon]